MFGYVTAYKPELKIKDFASYRAFYCGLCSTLHRSHGWKGQMLLSYDMTFLIVLLTSLYETETNEEKSRCIVHPIGKRDKFWNEITEYVADMNVVLSYYHFMDDWMDEKSKAGLTAMRTFRKSFLQVEKKYPEKCTKIKKSLRELHLLEKKNEQSIDKVSGCFGRLMGELFIYKNDIWKEDLQKVGFFLGKFVYLMDAYDDIQKDIKNDSYNPLKNLYNRSEYGPESEFEYECNKFLTLMMSDCTISFEKLPCVEYIDILRNILYVGVWNQYDKNRKERYFSTEDSSGTSSQES